MKMEWVTIRPNGKPVEPGTFCRVLDLEDGTHPIAFYGKTQEEVNDKIALNNLHARKALERRTEATPEPETPILIRPRSRLTAEETMQATADLSNPAKAAEAAARLVQDATGIDPRKMAMDTFKARADDWIREHPEFYNCKPNRTLLATKLGQIVDGDVSLITKEIMTQTYKQMIAAGELFEEPASDEVTVEVEPLPGESQVQRVETPRSGRNGTGTPSTRFRGGAPSTQTKALKYTREQIDRMSMAKSKALIESGDKDYAEACEFYYPSTVKVSA
jgi:hypothetical protein